MTEDFRTKAPSPLAPRAFNLPIPQEKVLSNGLKLVVVEDHRLPIVSFRLAFKNGTAHDPADLPGLTSMLTTMLNEGTVKRTSLQIASEVENLGASLSSSAGADSTVVAASSLAVYTGEILDLMADIVLNPSFPDEELHLQRDNAKQGLIAQRAQPGFLSDERLSKVLFGEHPYSVVSATEESLDKLAREKLEEFHRQMFVPSNAVFVAVGDVNGDELKDTLENLFSGWEKGAELNNQFPAPPARAGREIYLVDRPASAQSNIVLANLAIDRNDPDFFPFLVMNQVLGAGASSRLFMNLREQKDFTYGAYSSLDARRSAGAFEATAEVRSAVTGDALKEFFYELDRIRDEAVPAQELQDAKNYMTGVFPIRLETQEGLIGQLVTMQMYDLPPDYLQTYRDKINEITVPDVQRVAREYITPEKMAVVIVGDENTVYEQIQPYAENIRLYNAQGNQKERNTMNNATSGAGETWNLEVTSPQGNLPITMVLLKEGESITGTLNTPVGDGAITAGAISGNSLEATASLSFQGMPVNVKITGTINGDSVSGSVDTGILGSLPFTGTRAS